jgi:hypothetical protein
LLGQQPVLGTLHRPSQYVRGRLINGGRGVTFQGHEDLRADQALSTTVLINMCDPAHLSLLPPKERALLQTLYHLFPGGTHGKEGRDFSRVWQKRGTVCMRYQREAAGQRLGPNRRTA